MVFQDLKTGDLVTLVRLRHAFIIQARKQPKTLVSARIRSDNSVEADDMFYPGAIPDGAQALYMGSHVDGLRAAMKAKVGPYGYTPKQLVFHLVMWDGKAVWVSSDDAELRRV